MGKRKHLNLLLLVAVLFLTSAVISCERGAGGGDNDSESDNNQTDDDLIDDDQINDDQTDDDQIDDDLADDDSLDDDLDDDTTPVDYCEIDGHVYVAGTTHPQNVCLLCDPTQNPWAWSFNDGATCEDDVYCNGIDECLSGACQVHAGNPCGADAVFCNGAEFCDEIADICNHEGNPCPNDGLWCNGVESCNEDQDICSTTGNPCPDDGLYCNGIETCLETEDRCAAAEVPLCPDDGLWCNGEEFCDEDSDQCAHRLAPECTDDGLFCNGDEFCDENSNECAHEGNPCLISELWCDEDNDACQEVDCAAVAEASIEVCDMTLEDTQGVAQDAAGLQAWCEMSEALFTADSEIAAPFWDCWADCVFSEACDASCFAECLAPPDPGPGCGHIAHEIYQCGASLTYNHLTTFYIPEMDLAAACDTLDRDWECYWDCMAPVTCDSPPTPEQTQFVADCITFCDPSPAVEFDGVAQCAQIPFDPALNAPEFTLELWAYLDEVAEPGASYPIASRLYVSAVDALETGGWEIGVVNADYGPFSIDSFYITRADSTGTDLQDILGPVAVPGHWYHLALQFDGLGFQLFVDGALRESGWYPSSLFYRDANLAFGCPPAQSKHSSGLARGLVDEARLSDAALHNFSFFTPQFENGVTTDTVALWHMNEGAGPDLWDAGPLSLHGTLAAPELRDWRIAWHNWAPLQTTVYNNGARFAGYNARVAEEIYYQNSGGGFDSSYCDTLAGLLMWDPNLNEDPGITFQFGTCNSTGYTFYTVHDHGDQVYEFTD